MSFKVIIPARRASTRLPDKVLRKINGQPMLAHVCQQALKSQALQVWVATDDQDVAAAAEQAGAQVAITRADHRCGTERLAQVVADQHWDDHDIVVNVQGDEPMMPPALINQVAAALQNHPKAGIATAYTPITDVAELHNPNVVKVVANAQEQAVYFSRAPIPYHRDSQNQDLSPAVNRHLGIYAYRVATLKRFVAAAPSVLETTESLEQLRAYDLGIAIELAKAEQVPGPGVDTEEDLLMVERLLQQA